jgi:hypothetical protein
MAPASVATCVVILSDKSSGSSILQAELRTHPSVNGVMVTPHQEGETLYWNKAAALLGLSQERMLDSTVLPLTSSKARRALVGLCADNLVAFQPPTDDRELVFEGWRALVLAGRPVFLEKSPHHLHYRSALDLIQEAESTSPDIAYRYLGLIRDPVDTLHSMWTRWRVPPDRRQHEWVRAYRNLADFAAETGAGFRLVRYEDLAADPCAVLADLCRFIGVEPWPGLGATITSASVGSGHRDPDFGFRASPELVELARRWGYPPPFPRQTEGAVQRLWRSAAFFVRKSRRRVGGPRKVSPTQPEFR